MPSRRNCCLAQGGNDKQSCASQAAGVGKAYKPHERPTMSWVRAKPWHRCLPRPFRKPLRCVPLLGIFSERDPWGHKDTRISPCSSHPAADSNSSWNQDKESSSPPVFKPLLQSSTLRSLTPVLFFQLHCTSRQNTMATHPDQGAGNAEYYGPRWVRLGIGTDCCYNSLSLAFLPAPMGFLFLWKLSFASCLGQVGSQQAPGMCPWLDN